MSRNPRQGRRLARSAKYASPSTTAPEAAPSPDRRIGRLYTVTRPDSAFCGRVGIVRAIELDTIVLEVKRRPAGFGSQRLAFAAAELLAFDPVLDRVRS